MFFGRPKSQYRKINKVAGGTLVGVASLLLAGAFLPSAFAAADSWQTPQLVTSSTATFDRSVAIAADPSTGVIGYPTAGTAMSMVYDGKGVAHQVFMSGTAIMYKSSTGILQGLPVTTTKDYITSNPQIDYSAPAKRLYVKYDMVPVNKVGEDNHLTDTLVYLAVSAPADATGSFAGTTWTIERVASGTPEQPGGAAVHPGCDGGAPSTSSLAVTKAVEAIVSWGMWDTNCYLAKDAQHAHIRYAIRGIAGGWGRFGSVDFITRPLFGHLTADPVSGLTYLAWSDNTGGMVAINGAGQIAWRNNDITGGESAPNTTLAVSPDGDISVFWWNTTMDAVRTAKLDSAPETIFTGASVGWGHLQWVGLSAAASKTQIGAIVRNSSQAYLLTFGHATTGGSGGGSTTTLTPASTVAPTATTATTATTAAPTATTVAPTATTAAPTATTAAPCDCTPSTTAAPVTTAAPATTTSTTQAPVAVLGTTVTPKLATTGVDMKPYAGTGFLLLGLGGVFLLNARRFRYTD